MIKEFIYSRNRDQWRFLLVLFFLIPGFSAEAEILGKFSFVSSTSHTKALKVNGWYATSPDNYFKIENGIPHLPVFESTTDISNPETGMLVYSRDDGKPMIYYGSAWVDFCSAINQTNLTGQAIFTVKDGIPFLPMNSNPPVTSSSGAILYSTTLQSIGVFNGTSWVPIKNLSHMTLSGNSHFSTDKESQSCCFPVLSADPLSATLGGIYISSQNNAIRYYDGSQWINITCGPVVITNPVTVQMGGNGLGGGIVTSTGGSVITKVGICWSTSIDPQRVFSAYNEHTPANQTGNFLCDLKGLLPNKQYYARAYAINEHDEVYYGLNMPFITTVTSPTIITLDPGEVTSISAVIGGTITSDGGSPITARGIMWSEVCDPINESGSCPINNPSLVYTNTEDGNGVGLFPSTMTALMAKKTYYVRAFAQNSLGISYGNLIEFMTKDFVAPVLNTASILISGITTESAVGRMEILNNGGDSILECGILLIDELDQRTFYPSETPNLKDKGIYFSALSGLTPKTTYRASGYAINGAGPSFTDETSFITLTNKETLPPTVLTTLPVQVKHSSALVGGNITSEGGDVVVHRGVCWGTGNDPALITDNRIMNGSGTGPFSCNISGLTPETEYNVWAFAINPDGITTYGNCQHFRTAVSTVPRVVTERIISIDGTSVTVQGSVPDNGGEKIEEWGFYWGPLDSTRTDDDFISCNLGNNPFLGTITGLSEGETYCVRAYARNRIGISYGYQVHFIARMQATLTTTGVSEITATTAKCGGNITSDGGSPVRKSGLCWNTRGNPVVADAHTEDGTGMGEFIHIMTGLMAEKFYCVRAYAISDVGTSYGQEVWFFSGTPEPAKVITVNPKSEPNGIAATSGGTVSSNGGLEILSGGICWSNQPGFSPELVAQENRTRQSVSGNFTSRLTGLSPGVKYYVKAYVVNSLGTTYYADNEMEFITNTFPSVETFEPDLTTLSSISVWTGGRVISDGGSAVKQSGVCWSTGKIPELKAGNFTRNDPGTGDFTTQITGLLGNTTYYVWAYAINEVGTTFGNMVSFTTAPPIKAFIVTTQPVELLSSTSANGGGVITSNGGDFVTTRGLVWSTEKDFIAETITDNKTASTGYFVGAFTGLMTNLKPNTFYYVRAYVENSAGVAYGDVVGFYTPTVPAVNTAATLALGSTKATGGGTVINDGGAGIISSGVVWSKVADFDPDTVVVNRKTTSGGSGSFTCELSGLEGGCTYYIRAFAKNMAGTGYGNQLNFITDTPTLPVVKTRTCWFVYRTTAYSGGQITDDGGDRIIDRGLVLSTVSGFNPTGQGVVKLSQTGTGIGYFTTSLSGLEPGKKYYYRAFAQNKVGIAYGVELSFTTLTAPTLETLQLTALSDGTLIIGGGIILNNGGEAISNAGVCWEKWMNNNEPPLPTIGLPTKTSNDRLNGNTFQSTLTGLSPATRYNFRAYAENLHGGLNYGNVVEFTTPPVRPTITTSYAEPVTLSSVLTGGNIISNGGADILESGVVWSTDPNFNPEDVTDNKIINVSGLLSFSTNITGFELSTAYYIRAYATNSVGTAYGNQVTATIFPTAPQLTTFDITDIGGYSAFSGGEITSDGGAPVTLKGLCWSKDPNPTYKIDQLDGQTTNCEGAEKFTGKITNLLPNTNYHVRAFAKNKVGIAYGLDKSFLTNALPLLVATTKVTDISATRARSGGVITNDGRTPILERGICYNTNNSTNIELWPRTSDKTTTGIGSFVADLSNLIPEKDYFVRAYAKNAVGTGYGSEVQFRTLAVVPPTVTTKIPSVNEGICRSGGDVLDDGGLPVNAWGVCWSLQDEPNFTPIGNKTAASAKQGSFEVNISGLLSGKTYFLKAFATNSLGTTAYGGVEAVQIPAILPLVSSVTMSNLTLSTGDAKASVTNDGGSTVTDCGFCWNTTSVLPEELLAENSISLGADGMVGALFNGTLTNLESGKTYYVWAYATNIVGTQFSSLPSTFNTPTLPTVSTSIPKTVARNSAVCGGNVSNTGGVVITSRGICYSESDEPTIADACNTYVTAAATGDFSLTVPDLKEGTKYYVRAFASNALGTGYGASESFITHTIPTVITANADFITSSGAKSGGNVTSTGGETLIARGVCWTSSSTEPPHQGLSTKTTDGTATGEFTSTLTGLTRGTTYYIRSYAQNSIGTAYGAVVTIKTLPSVPILATVTLEPVDDTTQKATSQVTDDGGDVVSLRGLCWNTSGNPTRENGNFVKINDSSGLGSYSDFITGLVEGPTYYIRAFAENNAGVAYGPVRSFKICPAAITVYHVKGLNGAPVDKKVTYQSVSSDISGKMACWLTRNLGADQQPVDFNDYSEPSKGWYWQFNRSQGYKHDGTTRIPSTYPSTSPTAPDGWIPENDPCSLLLGGGWRIPTKDEWDNAITKGGWTSSSIAFNSDLRLQNKSGCLLNSGSTYGFGSQGYYWSSTKSSSYGYNLNIYGGAPKIESSSLAYGFSVRCILTEVTPTIPVVSDVTIPNSDETSATCEATVALKGKDEILERGFCWNTTGTPPTIFNQSDLFVTADQGVDSGLGKFTSTLNNLTPGTTYFIRAYVKYSNTEAVYSPTTKKFSICPAQFDVYHVQGLDGAPMDKKVTYHTVRSELSGTEACWLTQNLGAAPDESGDDGSGWYYQFNKKQGYVHDGANRIPSVSWPSNTVGADWAITEDPCRLMLGGYWRIPTSQEWINADAALPGWTTAADALNSVLKLQMSGSLDLTNGNLLNKGAEGLYWSSKYYSNNIYSHNLKLTSTSRSVTYSNVKVGMSVRCLSEQLVITKPIVSGVKYVYTTDTSASFEATVANTGGATITERGFCWNTTGDTPTIDNSTVISFNGFVGEAGQGKYFYTATGLTEGRTYYVRAFARNNNDIGYSSAVTSFKICPAEFTVNHVNGVNGAPETKTVIYHSVSSNISGKAACWLTQNLGADCPPNEYNDATEAASGWYWQFNRLQGYRMNASVLTPSSWTSNLQNSDWSKDNDPCTKLLGETWHIPTYSDWLAADGAPQNWTIATDAYASDLKLHLAGNLDDKGKFPSSSLRGVEGRYWSRTINSGNYYGKIIYITTTSSATAVSLVSSGLPLRCIMD